MQRGRTIFAQARVQQRAQAKVDLQFEQRWRTLVKDLSARFDAGTLDLNAILFLIGVQELGQHAREFKKDEKVALMHIAICVLLRPYGYYRELGRDADGWPHFERIKDLPALGPEEQERLMKEAVLAYFEAGT
jgi:hypothetical protein